jgi:MFS family permease
LPATLALIWTITAAGTLLQAANGLLQALLPLRMQAQGLSIEAIGAVATAYGIGFAAGCLIAPAFVRRVGHIRAFATLAAIVAVLALAFTQARGAPSWFVLRALSGLALAGVFTVTDGWISARASAADRGRVVSVYMVSTKVALMLAPLGIGLGSVREDGLFMVVAALMCLSLLPVSATRSAEPAAPTTVRPELRAVFALAPSALVGAFAVGLMNGPVMAMAPVYGLSLGYGPETAAALLFALQVGSFAFQWPLGWLSDRVDRRLVIGGLAAGTALVSGLVALASGGPTWLVALGFLLWGGQALCIYAVCVAHACDVVAPERIVPTVSTLLVVWAAGMMLGPTPAAALMTRLGAQGLFVYAAVIGLCLAGFVAWRMAVRSRRPTAGGFVDLAPTSAATAALSPRAPAEGDPAQGRGRG